MTKPLVRIDPKLEFGEIGWLRHALSKAFATTSQSFADGVCHCLTPNDLGAALKAKRKHKRIVVSAFYCEATKGGNFLKKTNDGWVLTKKANRLLRIADAITVPSEAMKIWFREFHIQTPIVALPPPSDRSTYLKVSPDESAAFRRYVGIDVKEPYFLGRTKSDKKTLALLGSLGANLPKHKFVFVVYDNTARRIRALKRRLPNNVLLTAELPAGLAHAAIKDASAYISITGIRPDFVYANEAAVAGVQIFAYGEKALPPFIIGGKTGCVDTDPQSFFSHLNSWMLKEIPPTVQQAAYYTAPSTYKNTGQELIALYRPRKGE